MYWIGTVHQNWSYKFDSEHEKQICRKDWFEQHQCRGERREREIKDRHACRTHNEKGDKTHDKTSEHHETHVGNNIHCSQ